MTTAVAASPRISTKQRIVEERLTDPHGYTKIPNCLILVPGLVSTGAFYLYNVIRCAIRQDDELEISQKRLALVCDCEPRTVSSWARELREAGLISIVSGTFGRESVYSLLPLPVMAGATNFRLDPSSTASPDPSPAMAADMAHTMGKEENTKKTKEENRTITKACSDCVTTGETGLSDVVIAKALVDDLLQVARIFDLPLAPFRSDLLIDRFTSWLRHGMQQDTIAELIRRFSSALGQQPDLLRRIQERPSSSAQDFLQWSQGTIGNYVARCAAKPQRPAASQQQKPDEKWTARDLALYLREECLKVSDVPSPILVSAVSREIAQWKKDGLGNDVLKEMIDLFISDIDRLIRPGDMPWRSFIFHRNMLQDRVRTRVEAQKAKVGGKAYWLGY